MRDYTRLQWTINFKPKHMKFFEENSTDIQEFTRKAVEEKMQQMQGEQKKIAAYNQMGK